MRSRLVAVLLVVMLARTVPVYANGGPNASLTGTSGAETFPPEETHIGVRRENLTFQFPGFAHLDPLVTAEYLLDNPGATDETVEVAFLYVGRALALQDIQVVWQGQAVEVSGGGEVTGVLQNVVGGSRVTFYWLNPWTGSVYRTRTGPGPTQRVNFPIRLNAGEQGLLRVQYRQPSSGFDRANVWLGQRYLHYTYLLSPAKNWAFFDDLTIRVLAPGMPVATIPPLTRKGEGWLEGHFKTLPDSELHISIQPWGLSLSPRFAVALAAVGFVVALIAVGMWLQYLLG